MKIFVNARFLTQPISGVQRYGIECSRQIKKLCSDVIFLSPANILHEDIAGELDVKVIGYNKGHIWEQVDLPLFMLKQKNAPLLNLANTAPLVYSNNYITIHDLAFYHYPEWNSKAFSAWYNILIPRLAFGCKRIFTVSNTVKNEIMKSYGIAGAKISVTCNGISQAMSKVEVVSEAPKEKIILSVGTFNKRKNHQTLIHAFLNSDLKAQYKLVIIGDKNKVFSDTGFDESSFAGSNIIIYPTLSESELIGLYKKAEIIVSLSMYEGFGIPLLEGLYFGCKVLCSDIPVYREIYGSFAQFCNPLDKLNVSNALKEVAIKRNVASPDLTDEFFNKYRYKQAASVILNNIT